MSPLGEREPGAEPDEGAGEDLVSVRGTARTPAWPLAFALLAAAAFGLRTAALLDYVQLAAPAPNRSALLAIGAIEAAAALVTAATFAVLASRTLRRLPPSTRAPAYD
ncbi:MAG: hypothetical protein GEU94_13300 [Micromonosporaceae bacterium]|nr:hypothetical protein [Micromonosporaceae bacterium]